MATDWESTSCFPNAAAGKAHSFAMFSEGAATGRRLPASVPAVRQISDRLRRRPAESSVLRARAISCRPGVSATAPCTALPFSRSTPRVAACVELRTSTTPRPVARSISASTGSVVSSMIPRQCSLVAPARATRSAPIKNRPARTWRSPRRSVSLARPASVNCSLRRTSAAWGATRRKSVSTVCPGASV